MKLLRAHLLLAGVLGLAVAACAGPEGPAGTNGTNGTNGTAGPTGPQGPVGPAGPAAPVIAPVQARLYAKITAVSIPNAATTGGKPRVSYQLYLDAARTQLMPACKGGGTSGYGALTPNFTIAALQADAANAGTQRWQSYVNKTLGAYTVAAIEGGHDTYPGTLTDNGDGSCTYQFVADLSAPQDAGAVAAVTVAYVPGAVTRFGLQNNPGEPSTSTPAFDAFADVIPSTGVLLAADPRALVADAACGACHFQVAHHGAKRLTVGYCVSCHNAGLPDPDPAHVGSTSLDLSVMIHKIHQGGNLPSVTGVDLKGVAIPGAVKQVININGADYTGVRFPQDTGNCSVCHALTTGTGSDYWSTQASIASCGSCHDRTAFGATAPAGFALHAAGALGAVADGSCNACHASNATPAPVANIATKHALAVPTLATQKSRLTVLGLTGTAPGAIPVVRFSVTDPAGANQDLATSSLWTTAGARLALDLGFAVKPGEDWTNTGSGATTGFGSIVPGGSPAPGQPASFDLLAGLKATSPTVVKNADGTYTFTSGFTLPAAAVGSGVAVLEGHPNGASGEFPVRSGTLFFPITDTTVTPRRQVVDIAKCDRCHGMLSLHGGNRTDNIDACATCHNSEATDVTQRPQPYGTPGIDGKAEQSIHLATMVHAIHTGASLYSPGVVVYSFTGLPPGVGPATPVDYRGTLFPEGNSVGKCGICHLDANPLPSAETGIVNGITQVTVDSANQATYTRTSKTTAVCTSCHGTAVAAMHMSQNGAGWGLTEAALTTAQAFPFGPGAETCTVCHGPGAEFDPAKFHNR